MKRLNEYSREELHQLKSFVWSAKDELRAERTDDREAADSWMAEIDQAMYDKELKEKELPFGQDNLSDDAKLVLLEMHHECKNSERHKNTAEMIESRFPSLFSKIAKS